jgi:hypothetical protein
MAALALADDLHRVLSTAVDPDFYRRAYPEIDVPNLDPVMHYALHGWRDGRDPAPWFSAAAYLERHPDVAAAGLEPVYHYLTHGLAEGREIAPSAAGEAYRRAGLAADDPQAWRYAPAAPGVRPVTYVQPAAPPARLPPPELADADLVRPAFDVAYYLALNPHIANDPIDPVVHFLVHGWREMRDPHPSFSIADYLEAYPDIAAAGINPYVHYLRTGRAEGRLPRHPLGFRYDLLADMTPMDRRMALPEWKSGRAYTNAADKLAAGLRRARTGLRDLHLTFSHDDYVNHFGGVQLCLQREDAGFAALGRDHVHVYPLIAWPVVRSADEPAPLGVLLNGRQLGVFTPRTVARVLREACGAVPAGRRSFAIHSLLGHEVGETIDIIHAVGLEAGYFWLHDFASLCAGFHLLRNDVEDCAAPPPESAACSLCLYQPMRPRHLAQHGQLFDRLDLTVVSPSEPTLSLWKASWNFPAAAEVILPHARLVPRGPAAPRKPGPFRLAFPGVPVAHKGWPLFEALALRFADDPRYSFLHLGTRTPPGALPQFHPVSVTAERPRAMQETLEALDVDAVLIWSLVRETFSFTAYEAVAAGAAVITGPDSGNVAAFVHEGGHGLVLPDDDALIAAMESGEILSLARDARDVELYDLAFSGLTLELLSPEDAA